MLDVRRLRVLLAVQEHGGVAAAARSLAFTPPAISQQIAALERQLGMPLLDRSRRVARLTPAGRRLASHAEQVLLRLEAAEADLAALNGQPIGLLKVGVIPTLLRALLPSAIGRVRELAPDLELWIEQAEPEDSLSAVRRGDLDVAMASDYTVVPRRLPPGLDTWDLFIEPVLVAVPMQHWATAPRVRFADLQAERWIAPTPNTSCGVLLDRSTGLAGYEPVIVSRCADFEVAILLVSAGHGIALVPALTAEGHRLSGTPSVRFLKPEGPEIQRTLYLATRKGTGAAPAVACLQQALAERVKDLQL